MRQYSDLVRHVLETGVRKENRTGVDTLSTFGYYYEHDLRDGFPMLTTKEVSWKNIVIELLWFLSGSDKAAFLERHGCTFWKPWTNAEGTVSNCYGPAWREFPVHREGEELHFLNGTSIPTPTEPGYNDQIRWVVDELKRNPLSRRMVVSAWAPGIAQKAKLPPCHAMWIVNVQNESSGKQRVCLHLTQRSCDISLGIPYNLASYALLLTLLSRFSGIEPGIFGHSLVDAHIYTAKPDGSMAEYDHVPGLQEQIGRAPRALPTLQISDKIQSLEDVEKLLDPSVSTAEIMSLFVLQNYDPAPAIKFRVAV
jgi:thymidylate synthase